MHFSIRSLVFYNISLRYNFLQIVIVDKTKKNSRGVPTMNFIESVEDWIDKFTSEKLISYINQYLNKFYIPKISETIRP